MDEFMLGTGVVTPVPFAGRKGREMCLYIISNCTSAPGSHRWS